MFMSDWSALTTPPPPRRPPWTASAHFRDFRDSYPIDVSLTTASIFSVCCCSIDMCISMGSLVKLWISAHPPPPSYTHTCTVRKEVLAEKIDELVMWKILQIVRVESASFIVPVYSSVVSQSPYEIHLPLNTALVLFPGLLQKGYLVKSWKNLGWNCLKISGGQESSMNRDVIPTR
jgi:hypothetical protein